MYVGVNQQRKGSKVVKLHALKLRTGLINHWDEKAHRTYDVLKLDDVNVKNRSSIHLNPESDDQVVSAERCIAHWIHDQRPIKTSREWKKIWFVICLSKKRINMQVCIWLACHRRSLISWIWSTKKIDSIRANVLSVIPESIRILVDCALKKEWERKLEGIEYVKIVTSIFNCVSYQDSQNMPIKTSHFPLEIRYRTINDEVSNISNH